MTRGFPPHNYILSGELTLKIKKLKNNTVFTKGNKRKRWCCHGSGKKGKTKKEKQKKREVMFNSDVWCCSHKRIHTVCMFTCVRTLSAYVEVSLQVCACTCVCVCLLSRHLNDIKALCKLSPWQLFRIPSPLSV